MFQSTLRLLRGADPGVWLLLLGVSFLPSIPMGFMQVALPIYLDRIGLHPELIGTLFTISGIASAVMLVVFGLLADRYGRKPFILVGTVLPVCSYLILAFSTSKSLILTASAIGGIGLAGGMSGALVTAGYNALLSDKSSANTRTAIFSLAEIAWVAAVFLGSLLAGVPSLIQSHTGATYRASYHVMFLTIAVIGMLGTLAIIPVREHRSTTTLRTHWLPRQSVDRIVLLSVVLALLGFGLGFIVQLLPLWFHLRFGVSEAYLGPWYGLSQVLAVGSLALATPLSRRLGDVRYVILTQALASVFLLAMPFSPAASVAIVFWIGRTFVMNASWPVQQAYIMGIVESDERATASSLTYAAWSIASALTPPIGGALLAGRHFTAPFLLGAACYAIAMTMFFVWFRGVRPAADLPVHHAGHAAAGD